MVGMSVFPHFLYEHEILGFYIEPSTFGWFQTSTILNTFSIYVRMAYKVKYPPPTYPCLYLHLHYHSVGVERLWNLVM